MIYCDNQDDMNEEILRLDKKGNKFWFFNLSYDEFFFRDIINDANILRNASNVIQISLENSIMIDLRNIVDGSLEQWINLLEMEKNYGVKKVDFSNIKSRVLNDSAGTYLLGCYLQNYFNNYWKISMKNTIGSNAMEIFKSRYLKENIVRKLPDDLIPNFERESYRGGRNEIFLRGKLDIISYDVRSMYLSIMRDISVPNPATCKYSENVENFERYYDKYSCVMDVTVKVPYMKITPLPLNVKVDGVKKIIYPYGIFRGVYTSDELKNAEQYGVEILECHRIIHYYGKIKLFNEFANDVWNMRLKHNNRCLLKCEKCNYDDVKLCKFSIKNPDYNKPLDMMNKKVGNSLYGKFSQHIPLISYYGRESHMPDEYKEFVNDDTNYSVSLYEYFGDTYVDLHSRSKIDSKFCFCTISSFITARARMKLTNMMKISKEVEDAVVYCDTDSIKILNHNGIFIPSGKDLGDFMMEYYKKEPFYAPKFYGNKTKGISKNAEVISKNDESIEYKMRKPYKFRSAIRRKKVMGVWDYFTKTVHLQDDKRIWYGDNFAGQGILSKPYYINNWDNLEVSIDTKNIYT
jgi:hypothetical protein